MQEHLKFIEMAIDLARKSVVKHGGGPFGAVVVKEGEVIGVGMNAVTERNDPTAHAEVVAIRNACSQVGSFQLEDCIIYSSCEPCPMCLGAIYWARPKALYFAASKSDASKAGFDDSFIYHELEKDYRDRVIPTEKIETENVQLPFDVWADKKDRKEY
jgi:guanine deaminase